MRNNVYYAAIMNFQRYEEANNELSRLHKNYKGDIALVYAEQWDDGRECEIQDIFKKRPQTTTMVLVGEDEHYALIYDYIVCDYTLYRRLTQEEFEEEDMRLNGKLTKIMEESL